MPIDNPAARVAKDTAGGLIIAGAGTVYINGFYAAAVGGITSNGDIIVASLNTVYAENRKVASLGSVTAKGKVVSSGSQTVFAGANGPGAPVEIS
jgi:uncharacterized Zn-binding protein involved in type VI secretion